MLIYPTLDHYEKFAQNFVNMMAKPVDMSMMWGLLFLVFKVRETVAISCIDIMAQMLNSQARFAKLEYWPGEPNKPHLKMASKD